MTWRRVRRVRRVAWGFLGKVSVASYKPARFSLLIDFICKYRIRRAEDQDVLQSMITHEKSFVHWIEKEAAGEEGSLDAAICQLQYPLERPVASPVA